MEFATAGALLIVAFAAIAIAAPGLLRSRGGPALARAAAAAALAVLLFAALDPLQRTTIERTPEVLVVRTDAANRRAIAPPPNAQVVDAPSPSAALVAAAARAALADRPAVVTLQWTGPFAAGELPNASTGVRVQALVDVPPPPLDPSDLALRSVRALAAGRPAAFELVVRGAPPPLDVSLTLRTADGREVATETATTGPAPWRAEFTPPRTTTLAVEVDVRAGDVAYTGRGTIAVGPPPRVLVVGAAGRLSRAPAVQGLDVREVEALPPTLDEVDVVLLTHPLPPPDQERLAAFVVAGGGLFVLGGEGGGALPVDGEPLATIVPVRRLPMPDAPRAGAGSTADPRAEPEPKPEPPPKPPPERPPDTKPEPEPKPPPKPPDTGAPITGSTEGAQLRPGPVVEVEKRNIAIVLVVDRSGSMGEKVDAEEAVIEYAKLSAYETAAALGEGDEVALITFGSSSIVHLPLTPATDREAIRAKIERVVARDHDTLIRDALRDAGELLAKSKAPVKQIVIVSDGLIADMDELASTRLPIIAEAARLRNSGISISFIRIGQPGTAGLGNAKELSSPGSFVLARSGRHVPRLIAVEVVRGLTTAGRAPPNTGEPTDPTADATPTPDPKPEPKPDPKPEPETKPPPEPEVAKPEPEPTKPEPDPVPPPRPPLVVRAIVESPVLRPSPDEAIGYPTLDDVVPVTATLDATTLLVAGDDGVPLLAFCNRGTGRVAVWSADFLGPMGERFGAAPEFPGWFASWLTALLPAAASDPVPVVGAFAVTPSAPTLAELDALRAVTGAEPIATAAFAAPAAISVERRRSRAADYAWPAALMLVLLAAIERLRWRAS